ncbi:hypothetical protein D8674_002916 [Pyrus ussuriensis x Pyrus communis]|uniref:Uncharacterized protein n=1 Tax=Pyrus ussuriensis x Pyrus communis TaxID=2448454 RepID=A0A5N5FJN0_9ROSA|nr:hypothetical protein D8674_002916 [Pyrus ussuriensis x Pyrus communis]
MPGHLMSVESSTSRTINASQRDLGAELLEAEVDSRFLVQSSTGLRLISSLHLQQGGGTKHGALGVSDNNQCTTASNSNAVAMSPQLISNFEVSTSKEIKDDRKRSTATTAKKTRTGYEDGASLLQQ